MAPAERDSYLNPARQERSRRTELVIAEALSGLLREKSFPDISVAEIAQRAGVSVGGLYARFPSKDALLQLVQLRLLEDFERAALEALDPKRFEGAGIAVICAAYTQLLIHHLRSCRVEVLQVLRHAQANPETRERLRQFNIGVHDRLRALILARRAELGSADLSRRINLALFFTAAAARDAVLTSNLEVYPVQANDDELAHELALSFHSYLTAP